ncbi:MAG: AraC family transcriptional regulator [Calditrichaeota bacterium]|nr:MAG: AraC family transcriptional regulator [Calditrichota bacterium]
MSEMDQSVKNPFLRQEYQTRIHRVMDYIDKHLDQELSLDELAKVANFSPFHFHRIFHALVGETLNQFIQRIRIEKAATMLLGDPKKSITAVALDCGFNSSASFARLFRKAFSISASAWRFEQMQGKSKIDQMVSKNGEMKSKPREEIDTESAYISSINFNQIWRIHMKEQLQTQITVQTLPEMHLAYVRHIGPYKGDEKLFNRLFGTLFKWAGARGLLLTNDVKCLTIYHDNPEITDEDKLRISVCITVPKETAVDGEIGLMTVSAGKYAVGHFEIAVDEYQKAWDTLCGVWLPDSGYVPDDRLPFEVNLNDPREHPEGKHIIDICLPVRPL